MVAAQAVRDEGGLTGLCGGIAGLEQYDRYSAVLKRVTAGKSGATMTLAELEAAIGCLERNRVGEHAHLLDGNGRYTGPHESAATGRRRSDERDGAARAFGHKV